MEILTASVAICSTCREPLNAKGACLACLLRAGLEESDRASDSSDSLVFGDFEIARREDGSFWELGCGAMGVTYRALDKILHRTVALKVIETPAGAGDSQIVRERFLREARAAAALKHPNVAGIFQFGAAPEIDRCYYAMELVEGETLEALVRRDGPLKVERALEIAIQVTRALIGAAAQGLIHRDLKPGNIMITRSGAATAEMEVKVIDFGLAKATNAVAETDLTHGGFVGTPSFASPEQFGEAPADARSDIYSLGVTLWYALTGRVPYPGKTIEEIRSCQIQVALPVEQLVTRKVPALVIKLLRRALATDPAERPQSARALLSELELCRAAMEAAPRRRKRLLKMALGLGLFAICVVGLTSYLLHRQHAAAALSPERSIAVLPFENLSKDQENATFADGIQDDILTKLAKVADLKVISRTSVMQYRGAQNTRQIGEALHVSHVLEGSVRREGRRIRLNTQLIDTRTDQHVWAEEYDRGLTDVFATQAEIAQQIADELHVKLSSREKAALAEQPTKDLTAYDLYVCAAALIDPISTQNPSQDLLRGIEFLNKAIARDPAFLLAYCKLASAHDFLYFSADHTPARLALADAAVKSALRLRPDSGDAHLARALHFYWGYLDYDRARAELAVARRTLPNDPRIAAVAGLIDRRQGRWSEAVREAERAVELDPRNVQLLKGLGTNYWLQRAYEKCSDAWDRALALKPNDIDLRLSRAIIDLASRADTRPLHAILQKILAEDPASRAELAELSFWVAYDERDPLTAERALTALAENSTLSLGKDDFIELRRSFGEGLVARMKGDVVAAGAAFNAARAEQEKVVRAQPDYGQALCALGLIDAQLGRNEEALREGRRAVELVPLAKNSLSGADALYFFAMICAWTGEHDLAIEQLEKLAKIPAGPSYGNLRLDPAWDSLRGDPRFEKIVASLAPEKIKE